MTLLSSVITNIRYEIRDPDSTQYSDDELTVYANRSRVQLDAALGAMDSDWVSSTDTLTLGSGDSTVALPTDFNTDRALWYGSTRLEKKSVNWLVNELQLSSAGVPSFWGVQGENVLFEREADDDYDFVLHYNLKQAVWTTASTMPYSDEFNEAIAAMMVFQANNRNDIDANTNAYMFNYFMGVGMQKAVRRNFIPRRRRLDF